MSSRNVPSSFEIDQLIADRVDILRLAVRGEPHQLVLARVDLEAGEVGERRIEQAERMRESRSPRAASALLPSPIHADVVAHSPTPSMHSTAARSNGLKDRTPTPRATGDARRTTICGKVASSCNPSSANSSFTRLFRKSFSLSQTGIAARNERMPLRRIGEVGLEQPLELDERLVVEDDVVDVVERDLAFAQAILDRVGREVGVVLLAREALFLRGRDDLAVARPDAAALS